MCHTQYQPSTHFWSSTENTRKAGSFQGISVYILTVSWVLEIVHLNGRGSGKQSLILLYNEHGNELCGEHFSSELTSLSLLRKCFLYQCECRHPQSREGKQGSLVASY